MSKDDDTPKRGALVPVGDIPFDVPGVGRTLTAKRQAHHFTTLNQVTGWHYPTGPLHRQLNAPPQQQR